MVHDVAIIHMVMTMTMIRMIRVIIGMMHCVIIWVVNFIAMAIKDTVTKRLYFSIVSTAVVEFFFVGPM